MATEESKVMLVDGDRWPLLEPLGWYKTKFNGRAFYEPMPMTPFKNGEYIGFPVHGFYHESRAKWNDDESVSSDFSATRGGAWPRMTL